MGGPRARLLTASTLVLAALSLLHCGRDPGAGPVDPVWDRDVCERCQMVIGDRRFAMQIRLEQDGRVRHFDDPGCALLWLDAERAAGRSARELWVRDSQDDRWLDATAARFVDDHTTPMGYGFGAVSSPSADARDLEQTLAALRLREQERRSRAR